jgi:Na+-translocating ferredoxin:NAD+ oxidoreductase subunit G
VSSVLRDPGEAVMTEPQTPDAGSQAGATGGVPEVQEPSSFRLVATLGVGGAAAGLLLAVIHAWAEPRIEAHKAAVLEAAVQEVLAGPDRQVPLYLVAGALTTELPVGANPAKLPRVYAGFRDDALVGYAISSAQAGFQDQILVLFGYDLARGRVLGMRVLESKETPGLGDKIEKDEAWVGQFADAVVPMLGVKPGTRDPNDRREVDMITGVTISARAVIRIINNAVERWTPLIEAYEAAGGDGP